MTLERQIIKLIESLMAANRGAAIVRPLINGDELIRQIQELVTLTKAAKRRPK